MDSRSLSFRDEVMEATGGAGVDVVVNSLAGEALARSLEVLAPGGRFLELGKRDRLQGGQLPLRSLEDSRSFFLVDLLGLAAKRRNIAAVCCATPWVCSRRNGSRRYPSACSRRRSVRCIPHHLARGRHIGKVVMRMDQGPIAVLPSSGSGGSRPRRRHPC
jgi:NADPH:quinone reductase-like Zn-dependent oxidoreductase